MDTKNTLDERLQQAITMTDHIQESEAAAETQTSAERSISQRIPVGVLWIVGLALLTLIILLAQQTISDQDEDGSSEVEFLGRTVDLAEVGTEFPLNFGRDIGLEIDRVIDWMKKNLGFIFRSVRWGVVNALEPLETFMMWLPWPVTIIALAALSWHIVSYKMSIFSVVAMLLLGLFGLWDSTMETAALMVVTVTLCVLIAVPLGIWASQSDLLDAILRPLLDGMQTMPSFVYLVPAIAFFSLGNVPAVLATLIYAVPPAVRLTNLGIRQVPEETVEAVESFGATNWQSMIKVKIPLAMPTIMAGVNQTILMALAMVVIASLVGAGGLGEDVLRGLGRIEPGNTLLAGLGIVFLAIIIDRITQSYAKRQQSALGIESD